MRYAYFGSANRLAVDLGGEVTVYDTLDHRIGGFSQQQSGHGSLTFTSQHGTVDVARLPIVSGKRPTSTAADSHRPASSPVGTTPARSTTDDADVFAKIERLAQLHEKKIISAEEFAEKKKELLGRL